ncbi:hypothetical protein TNCV_3462001 [Trichonephila clavipes]|nr:hypothetical protein TNCV_3462001 [Trichonephila clavipes]
MTFYAVELLDDWNVDVPSWKYPRNLESPRMSYPGFSNDSKMMVVVFPPFTRRRTVLPSVMFRGARKEELILVADELGEKITPEMRVIDLKNLILDSDKYKNNKEFIDDYLDSIISDRKSKEEQARVTAESQLEFERINLEKVKLGIELGKINLERAKVKGIAMSCSVQIPKQSKLR